MTEDEIDPVYVHIDSYIDGRLRDMADRIDSISDRADRLSEMVLRTRVTTINNSLHVRALISWGHDINRLNELVLEVNGATQYLKDLTEEGFSPEDAYRKWHIEISRRVSRLFPDVRPDDLFSLCSEDLFS